MRKIFFVVSIGLIALVAGSTRHYFQPSHGSVSYAPPAAVVPPDTHPPLPSSSHSVQLPAKPLRAAVHQTTTTPRSDVHIPLEFEANRGQASDQYGYVAHGPTYSLGLSAGEIALSLHRPGVTAQKNPLASGLNGADDVETKASDLHLRLMGASKSAAMTGLEPKPGVSNYFIGNDPTKWRTNIPHFGTVKIAEAYPGIDLVFYGNPQQLEYDFQVAPGADPEAIRVGAEGASSAALDSEGNLILGTAAGDVQLKHPVAYQQIDGVRLPVQSDFRLVAGNAVQFSVGDYDRSKPLVIDPVLLYAVQIGGSNGNQGVALDVDSAGNAYVTGNTCSTDFPSTAGSFQTIQTNPAHTNCADAFVLKLDPTGSTLVYSDYIGGLLPQTGTGIAVDSTGAAYVTGMTTATNFPLVNNIGPTGPVQCNFSGAGMGCPDGFILKLSADGSQLLFSSLFGGSQATSGFAVKLDSATGDLVVLGSTNSSNFLPAPNTLQTTFGGGSCTHGIPCFVSFVLGLNPSTGAYRYGTYFGGSGSTLLTGMAVDGAGDIYITGSAAQPLASGLGSVTNNYPPSNSVAAGGSDIVVARLHPSGTSLSSAYITFIQGEADDGAVGIALDASQNAYVTGSTASLNLPVTSSAFQSSTSNKGTYTCGWRGAFAVMTPNDCGTGFVGKLNPAGALSFLTYLGGNGQDVGQALGIDSTGNIWVTGITSSNNFPFSSDAYLVSSSAFQTPFLAEMSSNGANLPFATEIAGFTGESTSLKIDSNNNVYVTGFAAQMPTTPGVYPADGAAFNPAFVQKWGSGPQPMLQVSATQLIFPSTAYGGTSAPQSVTLQNIGTGAMELGIQLGTATFDPTLPPGFLESNNCGTSLAAGASCTMTVTFEPTPAPPNCFPANGCYPTSPSGVIVIQNNTATLSQTITMNGTTGHGAAVGVIPNPIVFGAQAAGTTGASMYVDVESEGDIALSVSGASIAGPNASDFQITSIGTCNNPVPLGEIGCSLQMAFSPSASATGTRTASLILTDNAGDSPQTIPVSGIVKSTGPALTVTPGPLYAGIAAIGATSAGGQVIVYLTNPSTNTAVQVTALTLGGTNAADFSAASGNCGSVPFSVAAGGICYVPINFMPAAGTHGLRSATLSLTTNPALSGLPVIAITGDAVTNTDGSVHIISVPSPQNFGSVQVGSSSYAGQNLLSISNQSPIPCAGGAPTCGGPLTISSIATGLSDYTVVPQSSAAYCTAPPLTIPAGGYGCGFQIVFSPTANGNRNTTLSIISNDPMGPTVIPLFGSGLTLPLGSLSVTQLGFGNSAIGVASPPLTVMLQNIGQTNLSFSSATASANFGVASNNCPSTLAPNTSCTIGLSFTPPSAGPFTGTLTVTDNDYFGAQQTVALSGTGATGPQLRLTPSTLSFGNQAVNTASAAQTLTLTNSGDTAIVFPTGAFRASADYIVQDTTCGATLAPGASCVINVQFKPSFEFNDPGILLITDNATGNPQPVAMLGNGTSADGTPTIKLTSSANPSATGLPVTFTATVAGATSGLPVPTGTVTFEDSFTILGSVALNSSGQAILTTSALAVGTHVINAIYGGNAGYQSVQSTVLDEVVNASSNVATTTTVISSINPSVFGQTVVFTANIVGAGGPTPTGNVMFLDGTTVLGTVALNGASQALLAYGSLATGSHSITAMYVGNANYAGSTSPGVTQIVNASTGVGTTTSLASSANPSSQGQSVIYTASVVGGGNSPLPTGTVTFMSGTTNLGTVVLSGAAQASFNAGALTAGSYSITAIYSGDATYAASSSTALTEVSVSPPYLWIANGNQTLSKFSIGGLPISPPGGYPGGGLGVAIDSSGNVWSGGSGNVTMLNSIGGGSQTFTGGGIATPASIAIAGDGSVWIANTNSTIANLANNGSALSPSTGYNGGGLSTPAGLAIDGSGNVWVTNTGDSSLTEFVGAAAPVVTPLAAAVKNANQGGQP